MSSEFFRDFQKFSEAVAKEKERSLRPTVYRILSSPRYYRNDAPGRYGADGVMRPGNHPYFETNFHSREPTTPLDCPSFVDFPLLVGTLQSLNSDQLWVDLLTQAPNRESRKIIDTIGRGDTQSAGIAISTGNRNLYDPFLVMLGAGIIYGRELESICTPYDKSYVAYPVVVRAISAYRRKASSVREVRDRLVEQLGTGNQKGPSYKEVVSRMKGCPAPRLLESILQTAGDYFDNDNNWNRFAHRVLFS